MYLYISIIEKENQVDTAIGANTSVITSEANASLPEIEIITKALDTN
jgi:hypothetical protein